MSTAAAAQGGGRPVTVRLPSVLREHAGGAAELTAGGPTLGKVLDETAAAHPVLGRRLRDERGELRRHVNFYVDGDECRSLAGPATPLDPGAEVIIIPSVAGG